MKDFSVVQLYKAVLEDKDSKLQREYHPNTLNQEIYLSRNGIRYNFYFTITNYFIKKSIYKFSIKCENIKSGKSFTFRFDVSRNIVTDLIQDWENERKLREDTDYLERKESLKIELESLLKSYNI